jgi:hypothetical protein
MTNTKKKNKNTRKLLGAIGMLSVSAAMLVSSTFAWFSLNKKVTATSMTVTAKSSSVYLLIGDEDATLATIQSANETTKAGKAAAITEIYPSAYKSNTTLSYTTQMTASADFADATKWYRATAAAPTASTAKAGSLVALTTTDFGKYVIHYQYKLALATGSQQASNLVVTGYTPTMTNVKTGTQETMQAVKVVVCGPNGYTELATTDTTGSATVLANTVSDSAVTTVDVYVYYDGNDESVFTNNIANLEGANFTIEFGVTAASDEPLAP